MAVEELALRTPAQGMEPQQDLPEQFPRVEGAGLVPVPFVGPLDHAVEVGEDGELAGGQGGKIGVVIHPPLGVQPLSAPFENVDFRRNGVSFLTGQHTGVIQP